MTHTPKLVTTQSLLNRLLSTPDLVSQIQSLPAPALLKIVNQIGLEDSAELIALATTDQLVRMVDDDLWRPTAPGSKEEFNVEKLGVWLSALAEMGFRPAAEKLSEMDEEFLAFVLQHYLHGLETEAVRFLYINMQGDSWEDSRLENLLENHSSTELSGVLVLAKPGAPWDLLLPLIEALDEVDTSLCGRLLRRLCAVTEAKAEREGGLYEVLSQEEMLGQDAEYSRALRRSHDGYVTFEDASAFFRWLEATPLEDLRTLKGRDPITRSYFRQYQGSLIVRETPSEVSPILAELMGDAEDLAPAPLLLTGTSSQLAELLAQLDSHDYQKFLMELNFLAQAVMLTTGGEPMRQAPAAEKVISIVERGIKFAGPAWKEKSAVQLFGLGKKA